MFQIKFHFFYFFLFLLTLSSCDNNNSAFEVKNFVPITNYQGNDSIKMLELDYTDAYLNGFVIPSVRQVKGGKFVFSFDLKNNLNNETEYFYKIYYQNESYKIPEDEERNENNFYGSWEEARMMFKRLGRIEADGKFHTISDSISIIGNPRNEQKFFGNQDDVPYSEEELTSLINYIKETPEWMESIMQKIKKSNLTLEKQIEQDAIFSLRDGKKKTIKNHRWKRNPRVGNYNFMLVVTTAAHLKDLPAPIQDISRVDSDSSYKNPFAFFSGSLSDFDNEIAVINKPALKVKASVPLDKGIFSNPSNFENPDYSKEYFSASCNSSEAVMKQAGLEQFIHIIDKTKTFNNVGRIADVNGDEFSKEYYKSVNKFSPIKVPITATDCPCKTVYYDSIQKKIIMFNPASENNKFRKENVGVVTRHGFTYGKFRVKVKLSQLLNRHQVWNGLTNAIWLLNMKGKWNQRGTCEKEGYIPKEVAAGPEAKRVPTNSYSEIDIEIVKAARGWPQTSYGNSNLKKPEEPVSDTDKIMVTTTNWDLACRDADDFEIGAFPVKHNENEYVMHRWDDWHQAITSKYPAPDDELFGRDYYWFEIEWTPKEIIWRMGPEKDKLREFSWMGEEITKIPDNQMILIITQEYHLSNWWPEAPYDQNKIPFPSKNIYGEILAIEVE